jgi:Tfp pilus assembly protein FimT
MVRRPLRRGLTLLEILLVITLIIMISAVAYPSLSALYMDTRVKAAADQVREEWTVARSHAIEGGMHYRFAVQSGTGKYRVAPDADEYWEGSNPESSDGIAIYTQEGELPNGILFNIEDGGESSAEGWVKLVVFNPDGSCQEDYEIVLKQDEDTTAFVVRVRAMTGAISVRRQTAEESQ